jgi:adenine/guanine phosphoribosyltransferase-like PRPP-binding protein
MLTLLAWEDELRRGPYAIDRVWSEADPEDSLHLDFSEVEFVDFGALAGALLLLDAAVKLGIPATITLPATSAFRPSKKTGRGPTLAERRARARGDALVFMRQVGFLRSLQAPHWEKNPVRIIDQAVPDAQEQGAPSDLPESDPHNDPYQPRRVFPFRWLEPMPAAQLRESESFIAVKAGLEDLGLPRSAAHTLSQTVLTELVENVAEHGSDSDRPPVALVGAILVTAEIYERRRTGMHEHLAEVAERAAADSSHVLRLIVADSGADLAARLAPASRRPGAGSGPGRSRQETILNALGMRSATTTGADGGRKGTTGLGWVARVVRSYHGGVQVRTADLLAGVLFGRGHGGTGVVEEGFSYVPGTLLELTLPTGPSPPLSRPSWESAALPAATPNFQWVNCFFDPERGLADADRTRLSELMRNSYPGRGADGVIITVPLPDIGSTGIDDRWRGATYQLLEYASSIARGGLVVVAFPDAEPHVLGPCVAAFNEEPALAADDTSDPILVLDCRGEPTWGGGSAPLRAVLTLLSDKGGAVDAAAVAECWRAGGGEPARLSETLNANRHLLESSTERVALRLSLTGVHKVVARAVGQYVANAIDAGKEGVELGTFRGPTLSLTDRWISVEPLLAATTGTSVVAFVLARKAEMALRGWAPPGDAPTGVYQAGSALRPLARHLSECLSLGGRFYQQQSELNIGEPPIGEQVPPGGKVLLCTDLIRTENTVRRAVRMIAGREADPLIIACVVDARDERGPIRLLNRTIPVVSLTEVDVGFNGSADEHVVDIDPLMLRPAPPGFGGSIPGAEVDLLSWCATGPDVLRLGHIDDPPRRHYSAFFRPQAMNQQEERDQITEAVLADVRLAFADIRAQSGTDPVTGRPLAIWYVPSDGNSKSLAGAVHRGLSADGFQVDAVTAVPRQAAGDAWAFPVSLSDQGRPVGVLIMHWWAITGSTLLHLVRLAAKSGASWIAAVCVLNQMDDPNDAEALRMLRVVSVPSALADAGAVGSADAPSRAAQVPVSIRFVAVSRITAFSPHDCPICATRDRYLLAADAAPLRLTRHAELLRDMLRPRELDEVARDSAADLFTVPVTARAAADYLRWRGLLLQARRTVRDRREVIDRLRTLTGENLLAFEWTAAGLIRLLAAEQHWLRLPPLYFQVGADLLSQVCVDSFEQLTAPLWLRVQALMVMSAAVPQRLVELLPKLLASAGNETVLVDQMLLDCCHLLRAPGNSAIDVAQLRHNLQECRDYLEKQRAVPDAAVAKEHLYAVRDLLSIADYRVLSKPKDAQAGWERLSEDLVRPVVRHGLETGLLLVRSFIEDAEREEPSPESAAAAEAEWDTCVRQLEQRVLANLPPLRQILAGDFVSDWLGRRDQRRLLTLSRPDVGELRAITSRLHILAHGPWRPGDPSWRAVRRELLDRINWWNRMFLAAHLADHEMPALLVELIRSAPCRSGPCLARILGSHRANATESGIEHGQVKVFCPEKLLEQVVTHLLENIEKHQVEGAIRRLHIEHVQPDQDAMRIVVHNSGTVACKQPGHGLEALNDKLRPFGGSLRGQESGEDEWTFAVEIKLALWHGG